MDSFNRLNRYIDSMIDSFELSNNEYIGKMSFNCMLIAIT